MEEMNSTMEEGDMEEVVEVEVEEEMKEGRREKASEMDRGGI